MSWNLFVFTGSGDFGQFVLFLCVQLVFKDLMSFDEIIQTSKEVSQILITNKIFYERDEKCMRKEAWS